MIEITIKWGTDKEEIKTYKFDNEEQERENKSRKNSRKGIIRATTKCKLTVDNLSY